MCSSSFTRRGHRTGGIRYDRNLYLSNAGKMGSATLAATGDGAAVAGAFKWVSTARYNDGSQVNWITLQPQDGIVLSSSCS
jgi:hypothetical protein